MSTPSRIILNILYNVKVEILNGCPSRLLRVITARYARFADVSFRSVTLILLPHLSEPFNSSIVDKVMSQNVIKESLSLSPLYFRIKTRFVSYD